jgi:hypothetical protein
MQPYHMCAKTYVHKCHTDVTASRAGEEAVAMLRVLRGQVEAAVGIDHIGREVFDVFYEQYLNTPQVMEDSPLPVHRDCVEA